MRLPRWLRWRSNEELDEEIRAHLELEIEENVARGRSREEARWTARRKFGNVGLVKERVRDDNPLDRLEGVLREMRYSLRQLRRRPLFAAVSVATLALTIGASTATFSLVKGILLDPLPFPDGNDLVSVVQISPEGDYRDSFTSMTAMRLRDEARTLQVGGLRRAAGFLERDGPPENLPISLVTREFFEMLGIRPESGRTPGSEDLLPDGTIPAMISYAGWQGKWGARADVLGERLTLEGLPTMTIVGVLPQEFRDPISGDLPAPVWALSDPAGPSPDSRPVFIVGRVTESLPIESVQAELDVIPAGRELVDDRRLLVRPLAEQVVDRDAEQALFLLAGAVALVLGIGVFNLMNLQVSWLSSRQRELSIRGALGESAWGVLRRIVTESMLLTLSGAVLGFALVYTIRDVAIASVPEILPRLADVPVDGYVFAFAVVAASVTGLAIGIVPIVRVTRPHLTEILNAATPRATSSRDQLRFRGVLTAVQTALAMTLVVSAGLLVGSFVKLVGVDTGFESQGLVMATVILPQKYDGVDDRRRVFGQMLEQLRLTPSVDAAALADGVPMGGRLAGLGLRREEGGFFNIVTAATSDDFGRVMGIGLRSGRWISAEEVTSGLPVAVVTESVAQELFPGEDPIGQQVVRGLTVVGVVARDMRWSMKSEPQPGLYYPYTLSEFSNFDGRTMVIAVRSAGLARDSMESVIREIEPDAAIDLRTMDRAIAENVARERFQTAVLATFAGAALLLACLGVYSVVSIGTAERTREIGLRVALGATPVKVVARMMRHGLVPALSGLSVGLVLSTASTRVLEAYLYELDRLDMRVFAFGFAVAMLLVLFASWLPARRAARLDPMEALRHE